MKKFNIEKRDEYKRTPLHHAAYKGDAKAVALLLDRGANLEARDKDNRTPLQIALGRGYPKVTALLRKRGAK